MADFLSEEKRLLLAKALGSAGQRNGNGRILRRSDGSPAPLSFAQQRIWFLQQLEPDNSQFNTPLGVSLTGSLEIPTLERTLSELVRRHETLRTIVHVSEGEAKQVCLPPFELKLAVRDLSNLTPADRQVRGRQIMDEEAARPFDLETAPLVRFLLLRLANDEHWLSMVTHHLVFDTWSIGIFGRELTAIYGAFIAGKPSPLEDLPIQYADFSLWQREQFEGEKAKRQLGYWIKKLEGAPPLLTLPLDRQRPPVQSFRGRIEAFAFPQSLSDSLNQLCRSEDTTLFTVLMAAFQTLLYRYSGAEEIIAGTAIGNRNHREIEGLIGCFINTLLFRTSFSGDPSFRELLRRVRQLSLEASANQNVPFEKIVSALHPKRDLSYSPLTQAMLILQNTEINAAAPSGLRIERLSMPERRAVQYDLVINLRETKDGLRGLLEYNTDLFDSSTAKRILKHFETQLHSIGAHPDQRVSALELVTEQERSELLAGFNQTQVEFTEHGLLPNLIERQTELRPEAVALRFAGAHLTYEELNDRANQLAHYFQSLGVRAESRVGVLMSRGVEAVIALLAVLKAGGAYVPLDPSYPRDRLEFMVKDSCPLILLTQQKLAGHLLAAKQAVVCIDSDWPRIACEKTVNLDTDLSPDNLAYVLYTSGSTGMPKGVMVTHRALENFLLAMSGELEMRSDDILAAVTTLAFDIAGLELYLPLIVGASVGLVSRETTNDARLLREEIVNLDATALQGTPTTWRMLLEAGLEPAPSFKCFCGGEAMPGDLKEALLATGAKVWNLYGPTETTIWSTLKRLTSDCPPALGRPIANTQVYVLDGALQPLPVGVAGELYIGGVGLARGYLNQPALTAERFIPDPFKGEPGARLYKTGDLVRYLSNGDLDYQGRVDFQVKIRGFRIELAEIETALTRHPWVRQAVVAARQNPSGEKGLVAYVVREPESQDAAGNLQFNVAELREFLLRSLPAYMIPQTFEVLAALPETQNGKIDRNLLPAPKFLPLDERRPFVSPRTQTEQQLTNIWSDLLGIDKISVDDDFFELGGDSLQMQRMIARVMQTFEQTVPVRAVFLNPSVSHIASLIDRTKQITASEENRLNGLVSDLSDEEVDSLLKDLLVVTS